MVDDFYLVINDDNLLSRANGSVISKSWQITYKSVNKRRILRVIVITIWYVNTYPLGGQGEHSPLNTSVSGHNNYFLKNILNFYLKLKKKKKNDL